MKKILIGIITCAMLTTSLSAPVLADETKWTDENRIVWKLGEDGNPVKIGIDTSIDDVLDENGNIVTIDSVVFNETNIAVNGKLIFCDTILYDGTTYIPVRKVSELLGQQVTWYEDIHVANIGSVPYEKSDNEIIENKRKVVAIEYVIFNEVQMAVNGNLVDCDTIICNETTYIPVRKVSELLGQQITWYEATKTVNIGSTPYIEPTPTPTQAPTLTEEDAFSMATGVFAEGEPVLAYAGQYTQDNPAPINTTQISTMTGFDGGTLTEAVRVMDTIRGERALALLQEWGATRWDGSPLPVLDENHEFMIVHLAYSFLWSNKEKCRNRLSYCGDFKVFSGDNSETSYSFILSNIPNRFSGTLKVGDSVDGLVVIQVNKADTCPKFLWRPDSKYREPDMWFSLV